VSRYTESSIKVLKGLDGIRKKPAMYIGPVDAHGVFTILRECMDNAVDEFYAGRNKEMTVEVLKNGYFAVHDAGEGIPVNKHPQEKVSTLEVILSNLHAGGKLEKSDAYKHTRGTHGVGVKATNALSERFVCYTHRKGVWYGTEYRKGVLKSKVKPIKTANMIYKPRYKTGTLILFKPDKTIFKQKVKLENIRQWANTTAYLSAGFKISLNLLGKKESYVFKRGILDYIDSEIKKHKCSKLSRKVLEVKGENIDLALIYTDMDGNHLYGYCNGLYQVDGGNHVNTCLSLLYNSLKPYAEKKQTFTRDEAVDGIIGIVNFKVDNPMFSSQTKDKLVDSRFDSLNKERLIKDIDAFWKANKTLAKAVCKRAALLKGAKEEFTIQRKAIRELNKKRDSNTKFPSKLAYVKNCPDNRRELYIVEGDSAGGTARAARMTKPMRYQETLGLRGKILNAYKAKDEKIMSSEEVLNILTAIGFDPKQKSPVDKLRVGKIILLSDPDPDGMHINALLLSLFSRLMPSIYKRGVIHVALSPKFILNEGGKQFFSNTLKGLEKNAKNIHKATYIKGWGEISASALRQIAFNPKTRKLIKIKSKQHCLSEMRKLMGLDISKRKELLGI